MLKKSKVSMIFADNLFVDSNKDIAHGQRKLPYTAAVGFNQTD